MRLFLGIGLPQTVAGRLAEAARTMLQAGTGRSIRWTRPDDMHITLSFLGSVEPTRLEQIQQSLAALHAGRLHLRLSGIGVFANAGMLLVKLEPSVALLNLGEQISLAMESCGFPREQRPYLPHVTLARAKGRIRIAPGRGNEPAFQQSFAASEFRLYQSFTPPEGARYLILRAFPLA